ISDGKMRLSRGALSLAVLLGSVNAACVNFRPPPTPIAAAVAGDAPTLVWTSRAGKHLVGQVGMQDNTLYVGGTDRKVYAIDLASGEVRWSARLPGMIVGGVLVLADTVYVATSRPDGQVHALQRKDGKTIWRVSPGTIAAPLAMIGGLLVAETQRGDVIGLDPASGKVRWRRRVGIARAPAAVAGDGAILVSTTDSLFRLAVSDGKILHRASSPGSVVAPWLAHEGALVAGTTDSQVVSIRPTDLKRLWTLPVDAPVLGSIAALGDTLFLATRVGTVYRIDPGSDPRVQRVARLDWPVTAPVTILGGQILLGGADGTIRALRPDGTESWRLRVWRPVELSPIPLGDGLLAIGGNGDLHRYRR
ncbi:MAG TPA: PQQ-binding-like beta-propeller repeat protein, partial [Gemmatimonadales bacterium]|nr:PQQ-binding-like beta-propeller repeat protein [Gemmatimonadales bacterium]